VQGCLPSHLIFFLRHSSHARVTLRRFCMGSCDLDWFWTDEPDGPAGDVCDSCLISDSQCSPSLLSSYMSGEVASMTMEKRGWSVEDAVWDGRIVVGRGKCTQLGNRGLAIRCGTMHFCQTTKDDDLASRTESHMPLSVKSESLGRRRVKPVVEMQLAALGLLRSWPISISCQAQCSFLLSWPSIVCARQRVYVREGQRRAFRDLGRFCASNIMV